MLLSINEYNKMEKESKSMLSNRFLEAFRPEAFADTGFPTRIDDLSEVYRFLDSMHDGRLKYYYETYHWCPTYEEFAMIRELATDIYRLSETQGRKGIVVKAPLLAAMYALRMISFLHKSSKERLAIFELGGGTGVLGAMLHKAGYRYMATDITQAFYLTQNYLWESLFPGCVKECIDSLEGLNQLSSEQMLHIPYWKLWELRNNDLEADIMVANHSLVEMAPNSLRFYLAYGKHLMRNSKYKLFVAEFPGSVALRGVEEMIRTFDKMGYAVLFSIADFIIFSLKDKEDISPVNLDELFKEYRASGFFPHYPNIEDPTAYTVSKSYIEAAEQEKVSYDELEKFFHSLRADYDTPDEEFIHYCGFEFI